MRSLTVKGSAQNRGQVHGEEFRKEIQELSSIRKGLLRGYLSHKNWDEILGIAQQQMQFLKNYSELYEEQKSLATAANVNEEDLIILNNYTDFRDFVDYTPADKDSGCTSFFLKNKMGTVAGQTWDMHASATPYVLNLRVEDEETTTEILTLTGCLALAGVNSHGLGVFINNMHCLEVSIGLSWPAVVRLMLKKKNVEEAATALAENIPCSGHNYLIADRRRGVNIETSGKRIEKINDVSDQGFFFHTNHYLGKLIEIENLKRQSSTTKKRYESMEQFQKEHPLDQMDYETLKKGLLLEGPTAQTICIPQPEEEHASMTCGGIIYNFSQAAGEGFSGCYSDNDIKKISF